jgi:hypothetical protein
MMNKYFRALDMFIVSLCVQQRWSPRYINKVYVLFMEEYLKIPITYAVGKDPVISKTQKILYQFLEKGYISSDPKLIGAPTKPTKELPDSSEIAQEIDIICESFGQISPGLEREGVEIPSYLHGSTYIKNKILEIGTPAGKVKEREHQLARNADFKILKRIESFELEFLHPNISKNVSDMQNIKNLDQLLTSLKNCKNKVA